MKKAVTKLALVTTVALIAFAATSCNNRHSHSGHDNHEHHAKSKQLALNDGRKWNVDDPTNAYVRKMQGIVERFDSRGSSDYNMLADSLRVQTTGMVVDCKMTGPDHDALHLWLEPVLNDVQTLAGKDEAEAKKSYDHVKSSLVEYDTYFE